MGLQPCLSLFCLLQGSMVLTNLITVVTAQDPQNGPPPTHSIQSISENGQFAEKGILSAFLNCSSKKLACGNPGLLLSAQAYSSPCDALLSWNVADTFLTVLPS